MLLSRSQLLLVELLGSNELAPHSGGSASQRISRPVGLAFVGDCSLTGRSTLGRYESTWWRSKWSAAAAGVDLAEVEEESSCSCQRGPGGRERGQNEAAYLRARGREGLSLSLFVLSQAAGCILFFTRFNDRHHFSLLLASAALEATVTFCSRLSGGPVAPPPLLLREHAGGFLSSSQDSTISSSLCT